MLLKKSQAGDVAPIPDQHKIQCPETLIKAPSGTVEARTEALNRDVGDKEMGDVRLMEGG